MARRLQYPSGMSTYRVQIAATFVSRSQSTALLTDHVSAHGVFVRTDSPPCVGELLRIEFLLPHTKTRVLMHGVAARIVEAEAGHSVPGVQIMFFAKEGTSSLLWDRFIQHVQETYPESVTCPIVLAEGVVDQVRRAHPRVTPSVSIDVGGASAVVGNLSMGGMFIKTEAEFDLGARICVTLEDPRNRARVQLGCVVRRQVFGAQRGIGVEFESLNATSRAALKEIVAAATPTEPVKALCELLVQRAQPQRKPTLPGLFAVRPSASVSGRTASPSPRAFA